MARNYLDSIIGKSSYTGQRAYNVADAAIDAVIQNMNRPVPNTSAPQPTRKTSTRKKQTKPKTKKIIDVSKGGEYIVKAGDTLSGILKETTGSYKNYREIAKANGISDPNKIYAGMKIKIPGYKEDSANKPAADSTKPVNPKPVNPKSIDSNSAAAATLAVKDSVTTPEDMTFRSLYKRTRARGMQLVNEGEEASRRQYQNSVIEDRKDYYRNILSRYNKLPGETNPQWVARAERLDRMSKMSGAVETVWPETYVMGGGAGAKVVRSALGAYRTLEQRPRTVNVKRMAEAKRKADNATTTQKYDNVINIKSGRRSTRGPEPVEVKPAATQAKPKVQEPATPAEEVQESRFNWITRMQAGARLGRMRTKNVVTNARQKAVERVNRLRQTKGKESKPTESNPTKQVRNKTSKTKSREEKLRGNESRTNARNAHRAKRNNKNSGSTVTL